MRRLFISLWVVTAVLLLSLHAAGAPLAGPAGAMPNAVSYLPFVARNWFPSAQPTPTTPPQITSISGRVVIAANGAPLGGATVEAFDAQEHFPPVATATANVQGEYSLGAIPEGDYYVLAYADGFARAIYDQAVVMQEAQLVSYGGQPVTEINFALAEGGAISGRVTLADRMTPLPGVEVIVSQAKYRWVDNLWFRGSSDASGHYRVEHLPLGEFLVVGVRDGYVNEFYDSVNYLSLYKAVVGQPPRETVGIDLAMDPEGRLSGRVIDAETSQPVEGAIIHMLPSGPGTAPTWGMGGETDALGGFTVNKLPPAEYLISARAGEYGDEIYNHRPCWAAADVVPVPPGAHVTGVEVRMRRGGLLRGHLFDEFGVPLPGFWMTIRLPDGELAGAMPSHARTDGSFQFRMPPGTYIIMADEVPGYVPEYYDAVYRPEDATRFVVTEGSEASGIDFTVQLAGSIAGTVYRSDGVTPVPGAQVYAFPIEADVGDGAVSGPDGQYRIEGLPSGRYRIEVNVPGYEMLVYYPGVTDVGAALPVQVAAPEETAGIDILVPEP